MSDLLDKLPVGRRADALIAKILGYGVVETDDCNGQDNLWLSKDDQSPALDDYGSPMELPFFSSSDHDAIDLIRHLADVNERQGGGPLMELVHDGRWHFKIGKVQKVGTEIASVITVAILDYFGETRQYDT